MAKSKWDDAEESTIYNYYKITIPSKLTVILLGDKCPQGPVVHPLSDAINT